jgi:SgrR family transcriptional regulator
MNIEQYYISLRKHYGTRKDGESFPITIDELTEVLYCTRRNAQFLINKMMEHQFIKWQPGRGRGNTSKMTFLQSLHDLILERAKQLAIQEKLKEAWKLIDQLQIVKYEFTEWLYLHFGFQQNDDEDILRFPFYRPVLDLDPTFIHRRTEAHLANQIFDTLVKYDEKNKEVVSHLAHYWETNEEKTVWMFYLRKGVRFHHGKVMTSEDVEFTFNRIMAHSNFEEFRTTVKEIKKIGKYGIEFILTESNILFLHYLCSEHCSILPHDLAEIEQSQSFATMPIGTGPFRMKKNNESVLFLEAYDYYFEGRPQLDAIEMWIWPNYDESKMIRRLEQADIFYGDYPVDQDSHTQLTNLEQGATYLTFNLQKKGPLQDSFLRAAIHYGLNREKMVQQLADMRELPSCSFFPEYSQEHFDNEYDLQHAKSLLGKSDYRGDLLHLYTYEMQSNELNANWLKRELGVLGINIDIVILPIHQLASPFVLEKADMIVAGEVLGVQPDVELVEMYTFRNGFIYNHLGKSQFRTVHQYISLCKKEENREKRKQYLINLQEELKEQHQLLFLYHTKQTVKHSHSLHGMMLNAWGKVEYKDIWIKR